MLPLIAMAIAAAGLFVPGACGDAGQESAVFDAGLPDHKAERESDGALQAEGVPISDGRVVDGAPADWIPMPSTPPDCLVYVAPDSAKARPAPSWTSCGEGCLQYLSSHPDGWTGLRLARGTARRGNRYLAYHINIGGGTDATEIQVLRVNDNRVMFDGMALSWLHRCSLSLRAVSADNVLLDVFYPLGDAGQIWRTLRYVVKPDEAIPHLVLDRSDTIVYDGYAVSDRLGVASYAREWAMQWHDLTLSSDVQVGWTSPDGRAIFGLQVVGTTVFASTALSQRSYATLVWNPTDGARPLVEYASIQQGGACCVQTDGTDMVWLEGDGWHRENADLFADLWLMTSPFVVRPNDLRPRKLHRAYQDFLLDGSVVVGGGYALTSERHLSGGTGRLILTRLSDGAFISIPPPAGFDWVYPLYVDETEFAAFQKPEGGPGSLAKPISIVRQSLAALGAFQPPDSGF